jgi:N-acyl-D-aspartate/D-glutamate deacylase
MLKTIIHGAKILDGTNSPEFKSDIAITEDGRLKLLPPGTKTEAENEFEAEGLFIAPGFIDVHTHDDTHVIRSPDMLNKISQGITTVITGNCGISASPVTLKGDVPNPLNLIGEKKHFVYPEFIDYSRAVERAQPSVNVAALIGHTSLRSNHMDDLFRPASETEIEAMRIQLRKALADGAIGLSSGLAYDTAFEAPKEEVMKLVEEVAHAEGIYTTHMRSEFEPILDAINEAFDTAGHRDVPLIISHLKCAGAANWGRSEEVLELLKKRSEKARFACDCYPYSASSSNLDLKQVTDKNDILITWSQDHPEQSNRLLADIANDWNLSLPDTARELMPAGAVYYCMSEEDVQTFLRYERTMIGSDGLPNDPHPHPRLWGAFPRVLGRYCRELKLLDLPEAIHKMTGKSAKEFGLKNRGVIADDYFADLVLFDFEKVSDRATYQSPDQPAEGIEKVWVNGVLSYQQGSKECGRAGQFLRKESAI